MSDKNLIVYYSWSGNTERIARSIHEKTGGDLIELKPEKPYPVSYNQVLDRAKKEIKNDYKPELKNNIKSINPYNAIFVGTPNWWSTLAPPVTSFLSQYDFSKKIIYPFLTHGGGGQGSIFKDVEKLCPKSKIMVGLSVRGSNLDEKKLENWLSNFNS